ncbi:uncharacterized protein EV422DRAFT_386370 [Fimicolochytrium jonesii]|uniref:uncharacterized protein n=1 Tax=Fimicolochytrium jonesii TaxID=1396493 RepID=UPI0022FDB527|nr:uncharacterized protein EV422DRAFT_386370 [Fimicolochytrium jonesii]KAI8822961.1 hypothetical protein EV422DRAFT_386370 [Fimicolochytrium jonesii]
MYHRTRPSQPQPVAPAKSGRRTAAAVHSQQPQLGSATYEQHRYQEHYYDHAQLPPTPAESPARGYTPRQDHSGGLSSPTISPTDLKSTDRVFPVPSVAFNADSLPRTSSLSRGRPFAQYDGLGPQSAPPVPSVPPQAYSNPARTSPLPPASNSAPINQSQPPLEFGGQRWNSSKDFEFPNRDSFVSSTSTDSSSLVDGPRKRTTLRSAAARLSALGPPSPMSVPVGGAVSTLKYDEYNDDEMNLPPMSTPPLESHLALVKGLHGSDLAMRRSSAASDIYSDVDVPLREIDPAGGSDDERPVPLKKREGRVDDDDGEWEADTDADTVQDSGLGAAKKELAPSQTQRPQYIEVPNAPRTMEASREMKPAAAPTAQLESATEDYSQAYFDALRDQLYDTLNRGPPVDRNSIIPPANRSAGRVASKIYESSYASSQTGEGMTDNAQSFRSAEIGPRSAEVLGNNNMYQAPRHFSTHSSTAHEFTNHASHGKANLRHGAHGGLASRTIVSGIMAKQNRHTGFQKRLFRCDGTLLICMSAKFVTLPAGSSFADIQRHFPIVFDEFVEAIRRFYPGGKGIGSLAYALLTTHKPGKFYIPKWIIPIWTINYVKAIVRQPAANPENKLARSFLICTSERDYVVCAPSADDFRRWTFLLSQAYVESEELEYDSHFAVPERWERCVNDLLKWDVRAGHMMMEVDLVDDEDEDRGSRYDRRSSMVAPQRKSSLATLSRRIEMDNQSLRARSMIGFDQFEMPPPGVPPMQIHPHGTPEAEMFNRMSAAVAAEAEAEEKDDEDQYDEDDEVTAYDQGANTYPASHQQQQQPSANQNIPLSQPGSRSPPSWDCTDSKPVTSTAPSAMQSYDNASSELEREISALMRVPTTNIPTYRNNPNAPLPPTSPTSAISPPPPKALPTPSQPIPAIPANHQPHHQTPKPPLSPDSFSALAQSLTKDLTTITRLLAHLRGDFIDPDRDSLPTPAGQDPAEAIFTPSEHITSHISRVAIPTLLDRVADALPVREEGTRETVRDLVGLGSGDWETVSRAWRREGEVAAQEVAARERELEGLCRHMITALASV